MSKPLDISKCPARPLQHHLDCNPLCEPIQLLIVTEIGRNTVPKFPTMLAKPHRAKKMHLLLADILYHPLQGKFNKV